MLKTYKITDNKFDPSITAEYIQHLVSEVKGLINTNIITNASLGYNIIELLETASTEEEIILSYEILYNISIGNATFADIITYFEDNNLSISFDSLEQYFIENSEDNGLSVKDTIVWESLYSTAIKITDSSRVWQEISDISWDFTPGDFNAFLGSVQATFTKLSAALKGGISIRVDTMSSSYYTFITSTKFFTKDQEYLQESLYKYMLHPIYSPLGDNVTIFRNERYALEAYIKKLKAALAIVKTPVFESNPLLTDMWSTMTDTGNSGKLSSSRRLITDCLMYRASLGSGVFVNNEYNNILQWILNTEFEDESKVTGDVKITPNVGMSQASEVIADIVHKTVENIDKFNLKVDDKLRECLELMADASSNIVKQTIDVNIMKLSNTISETIGKLFTSDEELQENKEKLANKEQDLTNSKTAFAYAKKVFNLIFKNYKIYYNSLPTRDYLFYKTMTEYVQKYIADDFVLTSLKEWNAMQVIYVSICVYFKNAPDVSYISNSDIKKFKAIVEKYYNDFRKYKNATVELLAELKQI